MLFQKRRDLIAKNGIRIRLGRFRRGRFGFGACLLAGLRTVQSAVKPSPADLDPGDQARRRHAKYDAQAADTSSRHTAGARRCAARKNPVYPPPSLPAHYTSASIDSFFIKPGDPAKVPPNIGKRR
jgi:hypothetical protein